MATAHTPLAKQNARKNTSVVNRDSCKNEHQGKNSWKVAVN